MVKVDNIPKNNIAVIMSVYKSDNPVHLRDAIESILKQTLNNDLYLYQDGDVSPELKNVIDEYVEKKKLIYFNELKNKGLAHALNYLIDIILKKNYHYVARMDSDDISHPYRLEKQLEYFLTHPDIDVCGTFCHEFGASYALHQKSLPTSHKKLEKYSIARCPFIHPSVMFRIHIFEKGHRYPTNTQLTEDMAFWFELLKSKFKFGNVNEVLLDYRLTENTVERRRGLNKAWSEFTIRLHNMFILKHVSFYNFSLIFSRLIFHLLPIPILKLAYKVMR